MGCTHLDGANFEGVSFIGDDFFGASLHNVDLKGAILSSDEFQQILANGFTGTLPDGTTAVPEPSNVMGVGAGIFFVGSMFSLTRKAKKGISCLV